MKSVRILPPSPYKPGLSGSSLREGHKTIKDKLGIRIPKSVAERGGSSYWVFWNPLTRPAQLVGLSLRERLKQLTASWGNEMIFGPPSPYKPGLSGSYLWEGRKAGRIKNAPPG